MKLCKRLAIVLVMMVLAFSLTGCGTEQTEAPAEPRTTIAGEWNMDMAALNELAGVKDEVFQKINYHVEDLNVAIEFTDDIIQASEDANQAEADAKAALQEAKDTVTAAVADKEKKEKEAAAAVEAVAAALKEAEEAAEALKVLTAAPEVESADATAKVEAAKEKAAALEEAAKAAQEAADTAAAAVETAAKSIEDAEAAVVEAEKVVEAAVKAAEEAAAVAEQHKEACKNPTADLVQTGKVILKLTGSGETVTTEEAYTATYESGNYLVSINGAEPRSFRIDGDQLVIINNLEEK